MRTHLDNKASTTGVDPIVELVSSGVTRDDNGNVEVYIQPDEEAWTREPSLRLTEGDALALADALRQAADLVAGSDPQAFVRIAMVEPNAADR